MDSDGFFTSSNGTDDCSQSEGMSATGLLDVWTSDLAWRAPCYVLITLLDDPKHSFTLLPKTVEILFQVDLAAPSIPGLESVLFLDGVNDCLMISDDQLPVTGDVMTLEAHVWCQRPAQQATRFPTSSTKRAFGWVRWEGVPMLRLRDQQGKAHEVHAQMLGPLPQQRWCHLAVQVTSGNLTFFLDGRRYDTFAWPGKAAWGTGDWTIGANSRESQPGNRCFCGKTGWHPDLRCRAIHSYDLSGDASSSAGSINPFVAQHGRHAGPLAV